MPESNQPHAEGGAAELMHRMARQVGGASLLPLTVQRYYALDFSQSKVETQNTAESTAQSVSELA